MMKVQVKTLSLVVSPKKVIQIVTQKIRKRKRTMMMRRKRVITIKRRVMRIKRVVMMIKRVVTMKTSQTVRTRRTVRML